MKKFPVAVLDNFYENPDLVRQFALSLDYSPSDDGRWPGKRSLPLHEVNQSFFTTFCNKIFRLFYNSDFRDIHYQVTTQFQSISNYSENAASELNSGWIHSDNAIFSGVVYLNPNPQKNTGTNIYTKIDENNTPLKQSEKFKLYLGEEPVDESEYASQLLDNNSIFEETISIKNVYNRMILFESEVFHGVQSLYSSSEPRLTQTFFVHTVNAGPYPVVRSKVI